MAGASDDDEQLSPEAARLATTGGGERQVGGCREGRRTAGMCSAAGAGACLAREREQSRAKARKWRDWRTAQVRYLLSSCHALPEM